MADLQTLIAKIEALPALQEDQSAKADAAHTAAENVTTVTETQNALVAQAQAAATVAINGAQGDSDAAKAAADASTKTFDDALDEIIEMASELKK